MNTALLTRRRAANLAPAAGRTFWWYSEGLTENPVQNAGLAPDGSSTAARMTARADGGAHYIYAFVPSGAPVTELGRPYTFSVFVKYAGHPHVRVNYQWYYTAHYIDLNLLTGEYTMPPLGNGARPRAHRVERLPDGWFRVSITEANLVDGDMNPAVMMVTPSGEMVFDGDGVSGVLMWGYQINAGGPVPYNPALPAL